MKKFFTKKRVIWTIIILLILSVLGYYIFGPKNVGGNIQTDTVKKLNLEQTVLATGQVVSGVDLSLSFQSSGVVKQVKVKEGDKVKVNQVLAMLDITNALANLTTARGNLAQAQANYEKVLAGASNEQIKVTEEAVAAAQVSLDNYNISLANTKLQQDTAVQNGYQTLVNTSITAISQSSNIDTVTPTISGIYTSQEQGMYKITLYNNGTMFQVSGLESAYGAVSTIPMKLGERGLYIQFSTVPSTADSWIIYIPNIYSSSYVTNNNAYEAALKARDIAVANVQAQINSAQISIRQAQANLDQLRAAARPAEINVAKAQILSAQGQVASAEATIENATLRAPANGTITSVDIKIGELTTAQKEVMVLQDVNNLHIEADISEANIASLKLNQTIDVTFDALGPDQHFKATVATINPASTVISGVVNFKVTVKVENITDIKPGMTANLVILVAQKDNVLAVPSSAIVSQNGKKYIRVIDDPNKKTYHQVEVQSGLEADGGMIEIISGLNENQAIVIFIKQ